MASEPTTHIATPDAQSGIATPFTVIGHRMMSLTSCTAVSRSKITALATRYDRIMKPS